MSEHYILDGKIPRLCTDYSHWNQSFFAKDNHIAENYIGDIHISTIFLGYDASFGLNPDASPLWFETMIFGGKFDEFQCRWSTWEEAIEGHQLALSLVRCSQQMEAEENLKQGFVWAGFILAIAIFILQFFSSLQ